VPPPPPPFPAVSANTAAPQLLSFDAGSTAFVNNGLPDAQFDGATEPAQALMPFFVDMAVADNGRDGVWYFANASALLVEWRTSARGNASDRYDFSVEYSAGAPGAFVFRYYAVGAYGAVATVGAQAGPEGEFLPSLFVRLSVGLMLGQDQTRSLGILIPSRRRRSRRGWWLCATR
jgi:hypothetical protein